MGKSFAVDERVVEAVGQTRALSVANLETAGRLAVQLLTSDNPSKQIRKRTASRTGWECEQMEHAVIALAKIFMDGAKAKLSGHAFRSVVAGMSLPEQHVDVLVQLFDAHRIDIRQCVSKDTGTCVPQYRNLEWRIDLELGTRFCRNSPKPIVTFRLDTASQKQSATLPQIQTTCLRVDYDGLKLMQRQLEAALNEIDSVHCSRIQRYMQ
ncbi:unnamed protein product [Hyaloperonospora brassicae]|uniref:COMM domain-containing protein n=1 Tax=Hyaloperonospora brassicae TaxID=162125 RepID=A0AAV0UHZ2_HYABA|nr:unnamed protein product [Hyaloperonospora brassicae]